MITSFYNGNRGQLMPILNANRITEDKKKEAMTRMEMRISKEAIKAMGLSACQVGCMSRGCCSKCHGSGHR